MTGAVKILRLHSHTYRQRKVKMRFAGAAYIRHTDSGDRTGLCQETQYRESPAGNAPIIRGTPIANDGELHSCLDQGCDIEDHRLIQPFEP
jgi:hypothetical protein